MGAQLKPVASEVGFARRQNHPLSKLLKSLMAESQSALDVLESVQKSPEGSKEAIDVLKVLMKSTDERVRMNASAKLLEHYENMAKINANAATTVIGFTESVSKAIENDALMRVMANAKYGGPKQLGYDEDDDSPDVDFSVVQQVE